MRTPTRLVLLGISVALLAVASVPWVSQGQAGGVINVNTTADEVNADGDCSLREAVETITSGSSVDACPLANVINLPAGTYVLTDGAFDLNADATINGGGAASTIIDGDNNDAIFDIFDAGDGAPTVVISSVTMQNGLAEGDGGAIDVDQDSSLTLNNSVVTDNEAGSDGGGIANDDGTVTLNNSTVTMNEAGNEGGGIYNEGPDTLILNNSVVSNNTAEEGGGIMNEFDAAAVINNSTISGNTASTDGGGITNDQCCGVEPTIITNSTISGNTASGYGGGIENTDEGALELTNVTISGNLAGVGGGLSNDSDTSATLTNVTLTDNTAKSGAGIYNGGTVSILNTIVSGNPFDNCLNEIGKPGGTITSLGHNLEDTDVCGFAAAGDQPLTEPMLGALAANGGPTQTHALLAGSPAIDTADDAACPATDQRGVTRPIDGDENGSALCDVGAYEFEPTDEPPPPPPGDDTIEGEVSDPNPDPGETVDVTVTVLDENGDPIVGVECAFSIVTQPGDDAALGSPTATTDENGNATVPLDVGSSSGLIEVEADCEGLTEVLAVNVGAVLAPETGTGSGDVSGLPIAGVTAAALAMLCATALLAVRRRA